MIMMYVMIELRCNVRRCDQPEMWTARVGQSPFEIEASSYCATFQIRRMLSSPRLYCVTYGTVAALYRYCSYKYRRLLVVVDYECRTTERCNKKNACSYPFWFLRLTSKYQQPLFLSQGALYQYMTWQHVPSRQQQEPKRRPGRPHSHGEWLRGRWHRWQW